MINLINSRDNLYPARIVISGNSNISLGAYRLLEKKLKQDLLKGKATITIISESPFHTCYGLLQECLSGEIDYQNLLIPLAEIYPQAEILLGHVTSRDEYKKLITVELTNGSEFKVPYDQYLEEEACFAHHSINKHETEFYIHTLDDILNLRQKLYALVTKAAAAKDRLTGSRFLRVVVAGNGLAGIELATSISSTVRQFCIDAGVPHLKPTVYLLLHNAELYEAAAFNRLLESYLKNQFFASGVRISAGIKVIRVNTDGAVCSDGNFLNCSLVVRTNTPVSEGFQVLPKGTDKFGRSGISGYWKAVNNFPGAIPEPASYLAAFKQGCRLGKNIALEITGKNLVELKSFEGTRAGSLKRGEGFCRFGPVILRGSVAWFVRTWLILRSMPTPLRNICIRNMTDSYFLRPQLKEIKKHLKRRGKQSLNLNTWAV